MTIRNAADFDLTDNPGSLPNMQGGILDYLQPMQFVRITKTTVNFKLVETTQTFYFKGVAQPLRPQALMMKPEGQRQWKWLMVHALPDVLLFPDDRIFYRGQNYRVMEKTDWKEYGYVEYHCAQDFTA